MAIETLFVLDRQAYTSVVIENIPRNMILSLQKFLKDNMNSPGKMTTVLSSTADCLRITKVHKSDRIAVVKYNIGWIKKNRFDAFYVNYAKVPLSMVIESFQSGNFQALIQLVQGDEPFELIETYSVF